MATKQAPLTKRSTVIAIAVLALAATPFAVKLLSPATAATGPAGPVTVPASTTRVTQEDVPIFLNGTGAAQALATVTVRTRVDGQLDHINYIEGQDVKAGQLLAQIDARPFQAQLAQAAAQKARDEAQWENAKLDLQRDNQLIKDDATTQQALDTQRALVNQLAAAVETDKAQINYAQVQLDYTTIKAPLAGRVGAKLVDPGNIVHAADQTGLLVINQVDPISVVFTLPESAFPDINSALHGGAKLAVLAYSRETDPVGNSEKVLAKGTLVLLNNQIDTTSGTIQLKANFANPGHVLWPGQYLNVGLQLGVRHNALTVPSAVIQRSQTGTYVFLVNQDESVEIRQVTVLQMQDGKAVIGKGLAAGDRVVLDGQYKLKPGIHIEEKTVAAVQPAASAGAGSAK
jgi:multidrug efflux system membrane fusion protein